MAVTANGDAAAAAATAATLDNIRPPPGIIIPPPGEIREAIEKTAGYVMRGGLGLEQRIRTNHGSNPKFSFLMSSDDPYNAYYEWRKDEIKEGRGTSVAAGRAGEAAPKPVKEEPKGPEKPPDFQFSARMPRISQKDLEVVRLTALFAARNGRAWMTQLAQREASNPQFQFLVPNHTFHAFFQSLLDQYVALLKESGIDGGGSKAREERLAELRRNLDDKYHVLARARQRAEYSKWLEEEKLRQEEEEEKKQIEFSRIDWNDFVVLETITFDDDKDAELPPPTTLNDLQYASLEEKNKMSISSNLRIEEAFPFEDTSYNAYPVKSYNVQAPTAQPAPATQTLPIQTAPAANGPNQQSAGRNLSAREQEEEDRIRERLEARDRMHQAQSGAKMGNGPVKIRENYVPRAAARAANKFDVQTGICPNCKQPIPLDELQEHMRIELMDPTWKEQKAKEDIRHATGSVSAVDVSNNIKRLASQRPDVFDPVTGNPLSEEELARMKRVAVSGVHGTDVQSDAHVVDQRQGLNVEDQIKAIHQKFALENKTS